MLNWVNVAVGRRLAELTLYRPFQCVWFQQRQFDCMGENATYFMTYFFSLSLQWSLEWVNES